MKEIKFGELGIGDKFECWASPYRKTSAETAICENSLHAVSFNLKDRVKVIEKGLNLELFAQDVKEIKKALVEIVSIVSKLEPHLKKDRT